jgi:hypothetical protein
MRRGREPLTNRKVVIAVVEVFAPARGRCHYAVSRGEPAPDEYMKRVREVVYSTNAPRKAESNACAPNIWRHRPND